MAGSRGPVPKPQAQRRRRNKVESPVDTATAGAAVDAPSVDAEWHPIAREWFESLAKSGQAAYYEASDWAQARLTAEMMSHLCSSDRPSAQMFASILQAASSLLTTEGERRRLRLELARGPQVDEDENASVANLADYMNRAGG